MPVNPKKRAIKEAKFLKALVEHTGNATEAYKAIQPHVTRGSAEVGGSKALGELRNSDITVLFEQIGCTKEAVISDLWTRMKNAKDADFIKGTVVLAKVGGWEVKRDDWKTLLDRDMDLVEVVKIRLRKSKDVKDLQKPIDIECKATDDVVVNANSDGSATRVAS